MLTFDKRSLNKMNAKKIHDFGWPDVMKLEEIEIPVPQADEILVKMFTSGKILPILLSGRAAMRS